MKPPLAGVRLLSLAEQYPGPYATTLLADLGADVINVERPAGGDPTRAFPGFWESLARGKRSAALDLKTAGGRAAFLAMVAGADAVLEGYRPGAVARLGVDYETLRQVNEQLVYVSVSGFGQDGPYRDRPGHDLCYQALAGTLYGQLARGGLPRPTTLELGDLTAGLLTAQAVLLGLVRRGRDGHGSYLDVSVFDGLVSLLSAHLGPVLNDTGTPGFPHEPGYAVFRASDGALLALGVAHEDHFWRRLCTLTQLESEQDLSAAQRLADRARLGDLLAARIATRTWADWERLLTEADVPHSAVHDLAGVAADPHTASRGLLVRTGPPGGQRRFVRQPLVVDGVGWGPQAGAPALGQHTTEVLGEAGLDEADITALLASGAARTPGTSGASQQGTSGQLWTDSGPEYVAPGVYRIPLPLPSDGLRAVNVYAIEGPGGLVLIDSGRALAEARAELERAVKSIGYDLSDVQAFLITHVHRDHYTQAVALRQEFGSRVYLGAGERASLRLAAEPGLLPVSTQLRLLRRSGAAALARQIEELTGDSGSSGDSWMWDDPDEWITDGAMLQAGGRQLEAIATPGHTHGHLVFRDARAGLLFAGDHVLPHITPSIGFEPAPGRLPLASYLDSLRRVRELPDNRLLPAHGPVTASVHGRVDELLAHHATRLTETAAAVAGGASTAAEVSVVLSWTSRQRPFGDLDPFNQMLAINETAAHLDLLAARQELHAFGGGALRRYQISAPSAPSAPSAKTEHPARELPGED